MALEHKEAISTLATEATATLNDTVTQMTKDGSAGRDQIQAQMRKLVTSKLSLGVILKSSRMLNNWISKAFRVCLGRWHERAASVRTYDSWTKRLFIKYAGFDHQNMMAKPQMEEFVAAVSLFDGEMSYAEVTESMEKVGASEDGIDMSCFIEWVNSTYRDIPLDVLNEGMTELVNSQPLAVAHVKTERQAQKMKMFAGYKVIAAGKRMIDLQVNRIISAWKTRAQDAAQQAVQDRLKAEAAVLLEGTVKSMTEQQDNATQLVGQAAAEKLEEVKLEEQTKLAAIKASLDGLTASAQSESAKKDEELTTLRKEADEKNTAAIQAQTKLDALQQMHLELVQKYEAVNKQKITFESLQKLRLEQKEAEKAELKAAGGQAQKEWKETEERLRYLLDEQKNKADALQTQLELSQTAAETANDELAKLKYEKGKVERELKIAVDLSRVDE